MVKNILRNELWCTHVSYKSYSFFFLIPSELKGLEEVSDRKGEGERKNREKNGKEERKREAGRVCGLKSHHLYMDLSTCSLSLRESIPLMLSRDTISGIPLFFFFGRR